ncbi:alkaline phosphatase family protein [Streptomyces sp. SL13]|uniref:phospholipase C n=1 Tax=Streptantibioticus silvisoli TaxID=2705255 RepID=A0AA90H0M1_9ACTN|nr:alkaline phosphatase family protein [Streptantibioticus silvisoli]MDI5969196.1 alkaline phosphatase family protein [Streptantibioticus silvisoli]
MSRGTRSGARRRAARWGGMAGAAVLAAAAASAPASAVPAHQGGIAATATPIKHVVVLFDENNSFDHYFGTYPKAANTDGTRFTASPRTPKDVNNLVTSGNLTSNANEYAPQRLTPAEAVTCDQNHSYSPEQYAYDGGKADQFVQSTETSKCSGGLFGEPGLSMDYFDGNTVTALWNYAQHYTLSDNSFGSAYGPSSPGAIELASGQTHGIISTDPASGTTDPKQTATPDPYTVASPNAQGVGTMINDPDPAFDDCSDTDHTATDALGELTGRNIGDLLNAKGISWGWFQGGFTPGTAWDGKSGDYAKCASVTHANVAGNPVEDYSPHHDPFNYYKSTANPHHLPPVSLDEVGHNGQANHNYDLSWFNKVAAAGKLPAVSFLKAPAYQDGHAGYSDPIDEQHFIVNEINAVQKSPQWADTAVVVAYDDSDGWYDHVYAPPKNGSKDTTVANGKTVDAAGCQAGPAAVAGYQDRCGPGPRLPMLLISPFTRTDAVNHTPLEQTSIIHFIEDNWHTGRIGDSSFDARANSLAALMDFRHPNDQQVLLNTDGSVASVRPIPHHGDIESGDPTSGGITFASDTQQLSAGSGLPSGPLTAGAALVVVAAAGVGYALRRRSVAARG